MNVRLVRLSSVLLLSVLCGAMLAVAQESRAVQDVKAFLAKFQEADGLFHSKSYGPAASALAAAHDLYQRAERRDPEVGRTDLSAKVGAFPAPAPSTILPSSTCPRASSTR